MKIINTRLLTILFLGFSSGLPLALTGTTLQAWFTSAHIPLMTIGALSLLGIPYTLKFLWAPVMDYYSIPKWGKRRGWILLTQFFLVLSLLVLSQLDPSSQAVFMGFIALAIAFFSASQDISITAYQTEILLPQERGMGAAYYVFAYRVALLISGGFALIFADYLGFKLTYEIMAFLIFLSMFTVQMAPQPLEKVSCLHSIVDLIKAGWADLFQREKIVWILLFIVFYKLGDALALSLMTNFLLQGLGFSLTEVGLAYKVVSFVATIFGALAGGALLSKWNIYRALLCFGLAQAFSNLFFVALAMAGKHYTLMAVSIFIENFCSGLSTAALLAFMMSLCHANYTASQFSLLSALASLNRVFLGPLAALLVAQFGWIPFFMYAFLLSFPGIVFLFFVKSKVNSPCLSSA
jgi:MFS transporter, PAT family, beta-lactamase induction signal transducer AmpG